MKQLDAKKSKTKAGRVAAALLTLLADILLIGVGLCVFALFHHVLPKKFHSQDLYSEEELQQGGGQFTLPGGNTLPSDHASPSEGNSDATSADGEDSSSDAAGQSSEVEPQKEEMTPEKLFALVAEEKRYGESTLPVRDSEELYCYMGENAWIAISRHSFGKGDDRVTYYAADIFVSSTVNLETYVCKDSKGNVTDGSVSQAAAEAGAVFAVNTDYFKSRSWGTTFETA